MDNPFNEMRQAIALATQVQSAADDNVFQMLRLVKGRLRHCWDRDQLRALKVELRDFNAVTGEWKKLGEKV